MKCSYCGKETEKIYRVLDCRLFRNMCRQCALYWGKTDTVCYVCKKRLGSTAYELHGRFYCEECFLRETEW